MSIIDMIRPARRNSDRPADGGGHSSWREDRDWGDGRSDEQRRWDWMFLLAYGTIGR